MWSKTKKKWRKTLHYIDEHPCYILSLINFITISCSDWYVQHDTNETLLYLLAQCNDVMSSGLETFSYCISSTHTLYLVEHRQKGIREAEKSIHMQYIRQYVNTSTSFTLIWKKEKNQTIWKIDAYQCWSFAVWNWERETSRAGNEMKNKKIFQSTCKCNQQKLTQISEAIGDDKSNEVSRRLFYVEKDNFQAITNWINIIKTISKMVTAVMRREGEKNERISMVIEQFIQLP